MSGTTTTSGGTMSGTTSGGTMSGTTTTSSGTMSGTTSSGTETEIETVEDIEELKKSTWEYLRGEVGGRPGRAGDSARDCARLRVTRGDEYARIVPLSICIDR